MNTINAKTCIMLIIDIQEKLTNMLSDNTVKDNAIKLAKIAGILNLSAIITEQYPKGLGETLLSIKESLIEAKYFEKTSFSILKENNFKEIIKSYNKNQIILFGIETHICVLQSAFDLINEGYEVFIVKDACGSRNNDNKESALKRLSNIGCQIVTTEMVLFELLENSKHPNFKEIQALIK